MGADMPGDEDHAVAHELVGDGDRLLGIAGVVGERQGHALPEDTACRIDVGDGHLGTVLDLLAPKNVLAREGAGGRNQDLGVGGSDIGRCHDDGGQGQGFGGDHNLALSPTIP